VPARDRAELLSRRPIPEGLKNSILYFLLSASAAKAELGKQDKGYQFLCHPSLKNNEQSHARDRMMAFLTDVKSVLQTDEDRNGITAALEVQYDELKRRLGARTPPLTSLKSTIIAELRQRKLLVINAANSKRKGIEYGSGFNFLIGGNTLGRGIAIPNLLVTYYVRHSITSQIDTMHQHARMFGYRKPTLKFTKLFITRDLYYRFREIQYSDTGLRDYIENNRTSFPASFPVEFAAGLNPSRRSILNANTTEAIWPGMQIYPNYMRLPQAAKSYTEVMSIVASALKELDWENDATGLNSKGVLGVQVDHSTIENILKKIRSKSTNAWSDKTIPDVVEKLVQRLGNSFMLRYRTAERTIGDNGFLAQGTISGREQSEARALRMPTLWIMSVTGKPDSIYGAGETFVFPTLIVPDSLPRLFLFNKD
jgi:hypothetical protein